MFSVHGKLLSTFQHQDILRQYSIGDVRTSQTRNGAVSMPGCGESNDSNSKMHAKAAPGTAKPVIDGKDEASQRSDACASSDKEDRKKMSEYAAFVDSQAEDSLKRLKEEIERDSK